MAAATLSIAGVSGDRDFDCFIGEDDGGTGTIKYYKNTGNLDDPAFTAESASNPYSNMYTFSPGSNPVCAYFPVQQKALTVYSP